MKYQIKTDLKAGAAVALFTLAAACGSVTDDLKKNDQSKNQNGNAPTIVSNAPQKDAANVALNGKIFVIFSEEMDAASITEGATFTVTVGDPAVRVQGTVIYAKSTAIFWPQLKPCPMGRLGATRSA